MATIIDSLLVTLGLDTTAYDKKRKQTEQQQGKDKERIKSGANDIAGALKTVGMEAAGLLLGFEGLKGAVMWFAGLNVANADLGRFARNTGLSARETQTWSNAIELAGGSAKDAQGDLRTLSASITALKATGDVSQLMLLFQRMGVSIYDAQGKTRNLMSIFMDLGDKLKNYNRADAFNLAKSAGISESTLNFILAQAAARRKMLETAEANNKINEREVEQAAELQKQWRSIGQEIKGDGTIILSALTPYLMAAFQWVYKLFNEFKQSPIVQAEISMISSGMKIFADIVKVAWHGLTELFGLLANSKVGKLIEKLFKIDASAWKGMAAEADRISKNLTSGRTAYDDGPPPPGAPRGMRNNNPGNIRFRGQNTATGVDAQGFAIFPTLADGIREANRELNLFNSRGINTIRAIVSKWAPSNENNTAAYIAGVAKRMGVNPDAQLTAADRQKLLQAIFSREVGAGKVSTAQISSALTGTPGALSAARFANAQAAGVAPTAGGGRVTHNSVHIDQITVHTQATDADGMAADLGGALQRKNIISQADTGQT